MPVGDNPSMLGKHAAMVDKVMGIPRGSTPYWVNGGMRYSPARVKYRPTVLSTQDTG